MVNLELQRTHALNTENPRVGGSIPSRPTTIFASIIKPSPLETSVCGKKSRQKLPASVSQQNKHKVIFSHAPLTKNATQSLED